MAPRPVARILVVSCCVLLNGCMARRINKLYPPVEPVQNQLTSISDAHKQLATLPRADLYAAVTEGDLQAHLAPVLKPSVPGATTVTVSLGLQRLIAAADFDTTQPFPGGGTVRFAGVATLNADIAVSGQELIVRPSFETIKLSKIVIRRALSKPTVAFVNEQVIKPFLANINGALQAQRIPIDLTVVETLKPQALLGGLPSVHAILGNDASFSIKVDRATVLVDMPAVRVLAKLGQGTQSVQYLPAVTPTAVTSVEQAFAAYQTAFNLLKVDQLGEIPPPYDNETTAAIAKRYLAGLVNDTLSNLGWSAGFIPPPFPPVTFQQEIRADPAPELNCSLNARSCDISWSCDQTRSCDPGWNCPDCAWYDGWCHVQKAGCEADKARYRVQCEAEKSTARAACEANKAAAKLACETAKTAEIAACTLNQQWLNAWSGAVFGQVDGTAFVENINARASVTSVTATDDLAQISIRGAIGGRADFRVAFRFTPIDAGHLACQVPWGGDVHFQVGVPPQVVQPSAALTPRPAAGAPPGTTLDLAYTIPPQPVTFKTSVPPAVALFTQNPQFFIVCAPAATLGLGAVALSQKLRDDLIKDTFDTSFGEQRGMLTITPVTLKIGAATLSLRPWWADKAVGFSIVR